ncbi:hypothetical protein ACS0TY_017803 [Phlomoides rotata]
MLCPQFLVIMDKVIAVQATHGAIIGIITSIRAFMLLMNVCLRMRCRRGRFNRQSYDLRFNITRQLEHVRYLTNLSDVTCRDHLRMNIDCFNRLCFLLENVGGLSSTRNVTIAEQVAMFLSVLSHHTKNRIVKHSFKRSGYTVSKHFNSVLNTLLKLHTILLINPQPVPDDCNDNRWKYFKGCLGALDGTYIPVKVLATDIPRYRNRKGFVSVNVLAVCDRNMNYIYVLSGWEGSAADSRVLCDAVTREHGLKVPHGNYYLCDNGYPNCEGFLTPYKENVKIVRGRRSWTKVEEDALIQCLTDIVTEVWKAENSFRAGFQRELEKGIRKLLPGTDIVATPHINSKMHVWKKEYGAVSDLLSKSGIGWNSTTSMIEVEDEAVWDGCKRWIEIFGKDRATEEYVVDPIDLVNKMYRNVMEQEGDTAEKQVSLTRDILHDTADNSICKPTNSTVKTLNKGKKRKNFEADLTNLVDSLGEFMKTSTVVMGNYGKGVEKEYPSTNETTKLTEIIKGIVGLKVPDKLKVCDELIQNTKRLVLFFSLPPDEQEEYVWMLLDGRL